MRIVYLHQYFNTIQMSGGTRSFEMARRLVEMGHSVDMVSSWREPTTRRGWFTTLEAGINVHWLPVPYSNHLTYGERLKAFMRFALASALRAASIPADVVFATSTPLTISLPAIYAARRCRVPMVFEVRDLWPEVPIAVGALRNPVARAAAKWLERLAYRSASRVVALSPGMKEGVVRAGKDPSRVETIPNSADLELFDEAAKSSREFRARYEWLQDRPMVLYAGTLGHINGVDDLVDVAAALKSISPSIRIVIIGDGAGRDTLERKAIDSGVLNDNLFMLAPMPKREIASAVCAADICLSLVVDLPALEANSANKFFDALAAGKPIALNYGGWQAELLAEHGAGIALTRDSEIAAGRLSELIEDRERREKMGAAARRLAEVHFSRDRLAKKLEQVLQTTVCERASKAP